jgi:hypothetical protein
MAAQEYKKRGGGYVGEQDDHNSLHERTEEDWGTKSGKDSGKTGERYLPRQAREKLSDEEYKRTTAKKRADTKKGKQFSAQPRDVADKTRAARDHRSKADLYAEAKKRDIPGRSKMSKEELFNALA